MVVVERGVRAGLGVGVRCRLAGVGVLLRVLLLGVDGRARGVRRVRGRGVAWLLGAGLVGWAGPSAEYVGVGGMALGAGGLRRGLTTRSQRTVVHRRRCRQGEGRGLG
ncbi:hypothetical protein C8R44DRAFT_791137 [Mycena epipterygia]|nr:hypothetical protein C8R44DRAFT_791137 [Mycena epipterygia]